MNYEHEFTNDSYIDIGNGIKFPTAGIRTGLGRQLAEQNVNAGHNAFGGTMKDVKANACGDPIAVPDRSAGGVPAARRQSQKLADGVWLLGGGSHNSVAIEFKDYVAVVEAPLDEQRSLAVIEEIVKLVPSEADPVRGEHAPAFRPRRRPADLHAHRRDDHHAPVELRLLHA